MHYVYKCVRCDDQTPHDLEWIKTFTDLQKIEFGVRCIEKLKGSKKECNTFQVVEVEIKHIKE